ncbi:PEP-CTERM sorting domain-containing protein, partial [Pontiellaceae bacterium B12227]|nr:PEP-CTERM sorting domain-containing protein [Pontiellaceae bacterium B12227]
RNLRDGSVKYNDIRLKTAGGFNLLSLRLVPTANSTGNPDWLQRWNPDTTSWQNVAEIFQNSPAIPNEVGMQTLQVVMDADGFGLFLDGANLVSDLAYDTVGATLNTVRLSSPDTASGVWYDDMSVTTIPEPATIGLIGLFGGGLIFIRRTFML